MVRDRAREALLENNLREYISGNEQMFCVDNNLAKDIKVMGKKLYAIDDGHVVEKDVIYENEKNYYYVRKNAYCEDDEYITLVYKKWLICDSGNFKEVYLTYGKGCIFNTRELAEQYLEAYNKYNMLWDLQHALEINKEKMKQCKKQIVEIEAKIDELMHKQNND